MNYNELLKDLDSTIKSESNEKIKKAMELFVRVDNTCKRMILHSSGFMYELTAANLRSHFDTMCLIGVIDDIIFDMEDDIKNAQ